MNCALWFLSPEKEVGVTPFSPPPLGFSGGVVPDPVVLIEVAMRDGSVWVVSGGGGSVSGSAGSVSSSGGSREVVVCGVSDSAEPI